MDYPKTFKEVINNSIEEILIELITEQIAFSMVVSTKNWSNPLPKRLAENEFIMIQVQEQTMSDSFYDGECVVINTQFEGEENSLVVFPQDVQGILHVDMKNPIIMKPFKDAPYSPVETMKVKGNPINNFKEGELTPGVKHSLECFIKGNPNLFN